MRSLSVPHRRPALLIGRALATLSAAMAIGSLLTPAHADDALTTTMPLAASKPSPKRGVPTPCPSPTPSPDGVTIIHFDTKAKSNGDFIEKKPIGHKDSVRVEILHPNSLTSAYDIKFEPQTIDNGIQAATTVLAALTKSFASAVPSGFTAVNADALLKGIAPGAVSPKHAPFATRLRKDIVSNVSAALVDAVRLNDLLGATGHTGALADAINARGSYASYEDLKQKEVEDFKKSLLKALSSAPENCNIRSSVQDLLNTSTDITTGSPANLDIVEKSKIDDYIKAIGDQQINMQKDVSRIQDLLLTNRVTCTLADGSTKVTDGYDAVVDALIQSYVDKEVSAERAKVATGKADPEYIAALNNQASPGNPSPTDIKSDILNQLPAYLRNSQALKDYVINVRNTMNLAAQGRLNQLAALRQSYADLESVTKDLVSVKKFPDTVTSDVLPLSQTNTDRLKITVTITPAAGVSLPSAVQLTVPDFSPPANVDASSDDPSHQLTLALEALNNASAKSAAATPAASGAAAASGGTGSAPTPSGQAHTVTLDVYGRWVPDFSAGFYFSDLRDRKYKAVPVSGNTTGAYTVDFDRYGNHIQGTSALFHVYQTSAGVGFLKWLAPITPAFTLGTELPNFRSVLVGVSAMIPFNQRQTRLFLTAGEVFGKVTVLDGVERGQQITATTVPIRQDYRAAGAFACTAIFNVNFSK